MVKKEEVLSALDNQIKSVRNESQKETLLAFKGLVRRCGIKEYNAKPNIVSKTYNIGDIAEAIVLKWLGLESEDLEHEVKSYFLNGWHTLTNKEVKTVYVIIYSKYFKGVYKINANEVLDKGDNFIKLMKQVKPERVLSWTRLNEIVKTF